MATGRGLTALLHGIRPNGIVASFYGSLTLPSLRRHLPVFPILGYNPWHMSPLSEIRLLHSPRVDAHPTVLGGKPFIRDTRLSIEFLQGLLATGWSKTRILEVYQYLEAEDLQPMVSEKTAF